MFDRHSSTSLNNRFIPLSEDYTNAIFAVDDDMRVPCGELAMALEVWYNSPTALVGFMPRVHVRGAENNWVYRCWWRTWWVGRYSIILTKAAFLHHDYFKEYTSVMSEDIRLLIDKNRNCEDIAMSFLIADKTHLPPIYVKGHLSDKGVLGGISTSSNVVTAEHMDARSKCLDDLTAMYDGVMPLVSSHVVVDSAANGWTYGPSTWWEFISSDLWNWF